jgi:polyphenol oxidase
LEVKPFRLTRRGSFSYFSLPGLEASGFMHGFCTKTALPPGFGTGAAEDFLATFSLDDYIRMEQVHADGIHVIQKGTTAPKVGDGLIMIRKGVAGIIRTADCVPIILCDATSGMAAIVHAGWRGTVLRIAGKAACMMAELGAVPSLMQALIGPCIGPCCYEVGQDVAERFRDAGFGEEVAVQRSDSLLLDLRKANTEDLEAAGVGSIHTLDLCTRCSQDLFFSARRKESGRQFSFVAIAR